MLKAGVSMRMEKLSRILEQVGQRDGIQGLRLGPEGTAMLALGGGKQLGFEFNESLDLLLLYMPVLDLPADPGRRLAMLESMLAKNYLKAGDCPGELSVDIQRGQAVYQCAFRADSLDADKLDLEIDHFLRQRDLYRHALEYGNGRSADTQTLPISQRVHPLQRLART